MYLLSSLEEPNVAPLVVVRDVSTGVIEEDNAVLDFCISLFGGFKILLHFVSVVLRSVVAPPVYLCQANLSIEFPRLALAMRWPSAST